MLSNAQTTHFEHLCTKWVEVIEMSKEIALSPGLEDLLRNPGE